MKDDELNKIRMDGPMSYNHFSEITAKDIAEAERSLRLQAKKRKKALKNLKDSYAIHKKK